MSAEGENDAILRECRALRLSMFRADRDYAVAALLEMNRAADRAIQMLPEKFHAPFLATLTVAQDSVRALRSDCKPTDYWIGDAADFIEVANGEIAP